MGNQARSLKAVNDNNNDDVCMCSGILCVRHTVFTLGIRALITLCYLMKDSAAQVKSVKHSISLMFALKYTIVLYLQYLTELSTVAWSADIVQSYTGRLLKDKR